MSPVHMHLLLNHVPVIGIIFVVVMLAVALRTRSSDIGKLGIALMAAIAMVTIVVYFTGEPAEESVEHIAGISETVIHDHEEAAEVAFIATSFTGVVALYLLWLFRRRQLSRWAPRLTLAMALVVTGLMAWTANLGGQIRHSEIRGAGIATEAAGDVDDDDR